MHVNIEDFNVIVEGDLTEEHPKHYTRMHIIYKFKGKKLDPDKLMKAVEMSQDRYCGVSATLKKAVELTYEIQIEE
jgi:putative redox protein